jgi:5'-3' exonuclease
MIFKKKNSTVKKKDGHHLLIDGRNLFYICYNGTKNDRHIFRKGNGAIELFLKKIYYLIKDNKYSSVYCYFDGDSSGILRTKIYSKYKLSRRTDNTVNVKHKKHFNFNKKQAELIDILKLMNVYVYSDNIVEADDMIAYHISTIHQQSKCDILSTDSDFFQLIDSRISIIYPQKRKLESKNSTITINNWQLFFDFHPRNQVLTKAICGDSADDIDGIKGLSTIKIKEHFSDFLLGNEATTYNFLLEKSHLIQKERNYNKLRPLIALKNLIENEIVINRNIKLIDLANPMLTTSVKKSLKKLLTNYNEQKISKYCYNLGITFVPKNEIFFKPFALLK